MHKTLVYVAYGWLALSGTMHLGIDVVAQYLRHKRVPGPETTLYYGLNSAYALSQILFGLFAIVVARRALDIVDSWPVVTLTLAAIAAWLAIGFLFIEYREPKIIAGIFAVLALAAIATRP